MSLIPLKNAITTLIAVLFLQTAFQSVANAGNDPQCRTDIQTLLNKYQKALNTSDTQKVIPLYTNDGVFMPSNKPTSIGQTQVKTAYQHVFKTLDLNVNFHIDEIERHGDIAFVRTTSDGEIKLLEKNTTIKNNSRELFILKRTDSEWKIYRYMFNEVS